MVSVKTVAFLALLGVASCARNLRKPDYSSEADDIRAMMEGVRAKTEGGQITAVAATTGAAKAGKGEFFAGEKKLDEEMMKKADRAEAIMKEVENMQDPTETKTAVAKSSKKNVPKETESERAARFFATHGMKKIGSALGDKLSADAEKKAMEEHAAAEKLIHADVPSTATSFSSSSGDLDLPEEEEDATYKKQWAAVDALKQRKMGLLETSSKPEASYGNEADDLKAMMEKVRTQTEGGDSSASLVGQKAQKVAPGEFFPGESKLDDQLMKKADQAAAIMKEVEKQGDPTVQKTKTSLAKVKVAARESESARAARFFATHGMKKMGHMLGEEMSAEAEKKALADRASAQKKISADVAVPASSQDLEMPEDDDEGADYKKQWALVDKLKKRKTI